MVEIVAQREHGFDLVCLRVRIHFDGQFNQKETGLCQKELDRSRDHPVAIDFIPEITANRPRGKAGSFCKATTADKNGSHLSAASLVGKNDSRVSGAGSGSSDSENDARETIGEVVGASGRQAGRTARPSTAGGRCACGTRCATGDDRIMKQ